MLSPALPQMQPALCCYHNRVLAPPHSRNQPSLPHVFSLRLWPQSQPLWDEFLVSPAIQQRSSQEASSRGAGHAQMFGP